MVFRGPQTLRRNAHRAQHQPYPADRQAQACVSPSQGANRTSLAFSLAAKHTSPHTSHRTQITTDGARARAKYLILFTLRYCRKPIQQRSGPRWHASEKPVHYETAFVSESIRASQLLQRTLDGPTPELLAESHPTNACCIRREAAELRRFSASQPPHHARALRFSRPCTSFAPRQFRMEGFTSS